MKMVQIGNETINYDVLKAKNIVKVTEIYHAVDVHTKKNGTIRIHGNSPQDASVFATQVRKNIH